MPLESRAVIEVMEELAKQDNLRVTFRESFRGGLIVGGIAAAGGLLAGPVGLAIGGAVGGCIAAVQAQGKFKPVVEVLAEMTPRQREELATRIQTILNSVDIYDAVNLLIFINGNMTLRGRLIQILIGYLRDELRMHIVD